MTWEDEWRGALRPAGSKHEMVEAMVRLRVREVGSEHDFSLWHDECFGEGWTMREVENA